MSDRSLSNLGDPKVGQRQTPVGHEDQILRFDVAMDDAIAMGISDRLDHLLDVRERSGEPHPMLEPRREGLSAESTDDDESTIDETRILEPQDIRMLKLSDQSCFPLKRRKHACGVSAGSKTDRSA